MRRFHEAYQQIREEMGEPVGGYGTLLRVVQFLPSSPQAVNEACNGRWDRRPALNGSGSSRGGVKHFTPPLFYLEGLV